MGADPLVGSVASGPEGLAEDLPCPGCQYNLRGLTVLRCPECGFAFHWSDLPQFREKAARKHWGLLEWFCWMPVIWIGLFASAFTPLLAVTVPLAISGFQASVESVLALPILGRFSWRRFRAWWEGVLIGYGLCAVTCYWLGRPLSHWDSTVMCPGSFPAWVLLVITAVESFLVQWWVVRRRSRQWQDPIPDRRLALACLAAKAFVAVPWTLIATGALAR